MYEEALVPFKHCTYARELKMENQNLGLGI